jgi:hypothetical protein
MSHIHRIAATAIAACAMATAILSPVARPNVMGRRQSRAHWPAAAPMSASPLNGAPGAGAPGPDASAPCEFETHIEEFAKADARDPVAIASSQLKLGHRFYKTVLDEAHKSFRVAIRASVIGIAFFVTAISFVLASGTQDAAAVSTISGGLVEVIAGINFVLYGMTTRQLRRFHAELEQTQRFLIANSICEIIPDAEAQTTARSQLVATIAVYRPSDS